MLKTCGCCDASDPSEVPNSLWAVRRRVRSCTPRPDDTSRQVMLGTFAAKARKRMTIATKSSSRSGSIGGAPKVCFHCLVNVDRCDCAARAREVTDVMGSADKQQIAKARRRPTGALLLPSISRAIHRNSERQRSCVSNVGIRCCASCQDLRSADHCWQRVKRPARRQRNADPGSGSNVSIPQQGSP
jgi:hypothetical protein